MLLRLRAFIALMFAFWLALSAGAAEISPSERDEFIRAVRLDLVADVEAGLKLGIDVNMTEPYRGETALMIAVRENSNKVIDALLKTPGIAIDLRAKNGDSAIMLASYLGNLKVVKELLQRGAAINHPGWTPLHYAATAGHLELIRLLLEHHAYIDAESPNKTTPLMMASRNGNIQVVQLLIEQGADVELKNALGMTALDFAESVEQRENAALLRQAMAAKMMRTK